MPANPFHSLQLDIKSVMYSMKIKNFYLHIELQYDEQNMHFALEICRFMIWHIFVIRKQSQNFYHAKISDIHNNC